MESYKFISIPDELWPLLAVTIQLEATIANIGMYDIAEDAGGLINMKLAFSVDDVYDEDDDINTFQLDGDDYANTGLISKSSLLSTPVITGELFRCFPQSNSLKMYK